MSKGIPNRLASCEVDMPHRLAEIWQVDVSLTVETYLCDGSWGFLRASDPMVRSPLGAVPPSYTRSLLVIGIPVAQ